MTITILDLAEFRGVEHEPDGGITEEALAKVRLDIVGGCAMCGVRIAAYNAYPSKSGVWKCERCIGEDGWTDAATANVEIQMLTALRDS